MDDSSLYTGVNNEPDGIFGNEAVDKDTEKILQDQRQLVAELTPKLKSLLDEIDAEIKLAVDFIADTIDNTKDDDTILRGELKAAARYRKYLQGLKTRFTLALSETEKVKNG